MKPDFDAVILLSHGSVLCGAEQNLIALAREMSDTLGVPVEASFLNYTAPQFEAAVGKLAAGGARRIRVVPYFLVHGKFLIENLPTLLEETRASHRVELTVAEHIGFHEALADAVIAAAADPQDETTLARAFGEAAAHCRDNPKCPLHGSVRCPASTREVEVVF